MSIFALEHVSENFNRTNSTCILQSLVNVSSEKCLNISNNTLICDPDPVVFSGLILTLIGLVLGIIIILISKLHTKTTKNNIFIVITMIFLDVGVALLMSVGKWYEQIITVIVASVLSFIVILFGEKQHGSQRKWMVFLFALFGVFAVIAFILVVLWVILKEKYLLVANMVCWCFEMIIVFIWSIYYLDSCRNPLYSVFLLMYEHIILVIILLLSLNSIFDCD